MGKCSTSVSRWEVVGGWVGVAYRKYTCIYMYHHADTVIVCAPFFGDHRCICVAVDDLVYLLQPPGFGGDAHDQQDGMRPVLAAG